MCICSNNIRGRFLLTMILIDFFYECLFHYSCYYFLFLVLCLSISLLQSSPFLRTCNKYLSYLSHFFVNAAHEKLPPSIPANKILLPSQNISLFLKKKLSQNICPSLLSIQIYLYINYDFFETQYYSHFSMH